MNPSQIIINSFFALTCALLIGTKSFAEPVNLGQLKKELVTYHTSGQYDEEFSKVIAKAKVFIDKTAEKNLHSKTPKRLALVLDIDETSLSNYPLMEQHHFCAPLDLFDKEHLKANEPALTSTLELYKDALKHHINVFFITGRTNVFKNATEKNLKRKGFAEWKAVYYKPRAYAKDSAIPFKSEIRAKIEQQGYVIVASIGDQASDLEGGHAMKTFKLPNPYYYIP